MKNKIVIATVLTAFAAGLFTSQNIFTTVQAQERALVEVVNTIDSPVPTAPVGTTSTVCENIEHWDKIVFRPKTSNIFTVDGTDSLRTNREYDIKVLDDPTTVVDLKQKVADKLEELGWKLLGPQGPEILANFIEIIDVEYAIACVPATRE